MMSSSLFLCAARGAENRCECLHISEIPNKLAICMFPHFSWALSNEAFCFSCLIDSRRRSHFFISAQEWCVIGKCRLHVLKCNFICIICPLAKRSFLFSKPNVWMWPVLESGEASISQQTTAASFVLPRTILNSRFMGAAEGHTKILIFSFFLF